MSPDAKTIEQEGVYLDNLRLVEAGRFMEDRALALLTGAEHPARNPAQNIADLKAQVAANARGAAELIRAVEAFGPGIASAYMRHVQDNAAESVRRVLDRLPPEASFAYPSGRSTATTLFVVPKSMPMAGRMAGGSPAGCAVEPAAARLASPSAAPPGGSLDHAVYSTRSGPCAGPLGAAAGAPSRLRPPL